MEVLWWGLVGWFPEIRAPDRNAPPHMAVAPLGGKLTGSRRPDRCLVVWCLALRA
jgi:hypothetical protein